MSQDLIARLDRIVDEQPFGSEISLACYQARNAHVAAEALNAAQAEQIGSVESHLVGLIRACKDAGVQQIPASIKRQPEREALTAMIHRCEKLMATPRSAETLETSALRTIADIAEGSTTANSLPHIAKIARTALSGGDDA